MPRKKTEKAQDAASQHIADIEQYVAGVISGEIPACKWVKLACKRHADDLAESKKASYPYRFDATLADRAIRFIQLMPHVSGRWAAAKELLRLEPWQKFIVGSIFGWIKKSTGKRRFRTIYACIPRKSAKSTLAAAIGLYCLLADGEWGAQVYCGASTEKQANFVFEPVKKMAEMTPALRSKYGLQVNAQSLLVPTTNSKFERLIGKPGDGGSPSLAIVDEYHEHPDSTLFDTMVTGLGAREQPIVLVITTAGFDISGPCYALQRDMEKTLEGTLDNPDFFAIIYTIDLEPYEFEGVKYPADDWTNEASLRKANPNFGVSVSEEFLLSELRVAIQSPEKQNAFKTKYLNIWCQARHGWMNMARWIEVGDERLRIEDFKGEKCVMGFDLAAQIDITALVLLFMHKIDGVEHYYCFPRFYLPESRALDQNCKHYQGWVNEKKLFATDGDETDFKLIKNHILLDAEKYQVAEFAFDKYQALNFKQQVSDETGILTAEIPQNAVTFTEPMRWLEGMVKSGRFHHPNHPVMNWMMSNVVVREDGNEMIFPRKERLENKIDGVTALLNALVCATRVFSGLDTKKKFVFNGF